MAEAVVVVVVVVVAEGERGGRATVSIEATKEGVKFACVGDIGSGAVTVRPHSDVDQPKLDVDIQLTEPVALTFSLKYLVHFCKATSLADSVKLGLSNDVPLLVEYAIAGSSYLRYYLAPKVRRPDDDDVIMMMPQDDSPRPRRSGTTSETRGGRWPLLE